MLINFANTLETLGPTHKFYGLIAAVVALLFIA